LTKVKKSKLKIMGEHEKDRVEKRLKGTT